MLPVDQMWMVAINPIYARTSASCRAELWHFRKRVYNIHMRIYGIYRTEHEWKWPNISSDVEGQELRIGYKTWILPVGGGVYYELVTADCFCSGPIYSVFSTWLLPSCHSVPPRCTTCPLPSPSSSSILPALQGSVCGWRRVGRPCPVRHLSLSPCDFRRCETRETSDGILVGGVPDIEPTSWLAHFELTWLNCPSNPTIAGCYASIFWEESV